MKKQVRLIIASTQVNTVYFNYGDDYSDITRVLVEDHSPWEEVDEDDLHSLEDFVGEFNRSNKTNAFAFLIIKEEQISAQSAITAILETRKKQLEAIREAERKRKEEADRKKAEREMKKLAKSKEQKKLLLEQLKKELGES